MYECKRYEAGEVKDRKQEEGGKRYKAGGKTTPWSIHSHQEVHVAPKVVVYPHHLQLRTSNHNFLMQQSRTSNRAFLMQHPLALKLRKYNC